MSPLVCSFTGTSEPGLAKRYNQILKLNVILYELIKLYLFLNFNFNYRYGVCNVNCMCVIIMFSTKSFVVSCAGHTSLTLLLAHVAILGYKWVLR